MKDWSQAPLTELADHIEEVHHSYLREAFPRLSSQFAELARAQGDSAPEVLSVHQLFTSLRAELESHLVKEEQVLFPMIRELEASATRPDFHCGTLRNPMRVMEMEHDDAQRVLSQLRELTRDYAPPEGADESYRAAVAGLAEFDADMQQHIDKESNVLFPRAAAAESAKPDGSDAVRAAHEDRGISR
jgi:regulator of cell morphogenesis and NO signaling